MMDRRTAARGEDKYEAEYEDGENEGEMEDFAALDALDTADAYRDMYNSDTETDNDSDY